jgi:hypothetical protein
MTLMILTKQTCVSALDILIMGSIPVIIVICLLHYSMWSFLHHHRCSVPSCPPQCRWFALQCLSTPQLLIYLGKKPRRLRDSIRVRRKSWGLIWTPAPKLRRYCFHMWAQLRSSLAQIQVNGWDGSMIEAIVTRVECGGRSALEMRLASYLSPFVLCFLKSHWRTSFITSSQPTMSGASSHIVSETCESWSCVLNTLSGESVCARERLKCRTMEPVSQIFLDGVDGLAIDCKRGKLSEIP